MAIDTPTHTPRRSKRYQPQVLYNADLRGTSDTRFSWIEASLLTRKTRITDVRDEEAFDEDEESETIFYNGFSRTLSSGKDQDFFLGDTVLVKTHGKLPSVGVIVAMWEVRPAGEEAYEQIKLQWFLRPTELPNVRAKRKHEVNEIYFSLSSTATLPPNAILGHCIVTSSGNAKGHRSVKVKGIGATDQFYVDSAIDALRGLYYELDWDAHKNSALENDEDEDGSSWIVVASLGPKKAKKSVKIARPRNARPESSEDEADSGDEYDQQSLEEEDAEVSEGETEEEDDAAEGEVEDEEDATTEKVPRTPSKKRKRTSQSKTPRKPKRQKRTIAAPTPHSKAALRARAKSKSLLPIRAATDLTLEFMKLDMGVLPDDPWLRAMQVLHVGARPEVLPCRENEFMHILRSVEGLLEEGSGGCVYVSGVPGTGKTATVHRIVRELKQMAERNAPNPFTYVEINGLRIPEPSAAYSLLWEAVSGHDVASDGHLKISSKEALKQLSKFFGSRSRSGPADHACIVLMDELDQLLTTKQEVVYNFFNWPTLVGSKLIVIAVANTHDLPERVMSGRVRSRLGMTRINYQPYDKAQLVKIVNARLQVAKEGFKGDFPEVIAQDAIVFASAKVASISGDARRVLDICRRAVELVRPQTKSARVGDVKAVITHMQSSHTASFLEDCSLHERIMLAALLKCVKRGGIDEVKWDDLQRQHLMYTESLTPSTSTAHKPSPSALHHILDALLASHALVAEDVPFHLSSGGGKGGSGKGGGVGGAGAGGGSGAGGYQLEGERRIMLNIEQSEVQRVLSDMGGQAWRNALGL